MTEFGVVRLTDKFTVRVLRHEGVDWAHRADLTAFAQGAGSPIYTHKSYIEEVALSRKGIENPFCYLKELGLKIRGTSPMSTFIIDAMWMTFLGLHHVSAENAQYAVAKLKDCELEQYSPPPPPPVATLDELRALEGRLDAMFRLMKDFDKRLNMLAHQQRNSESLAHSFDVKQFRRFLSAGYAMLKQAEEAGVE